MLTGYNCFATQPKMKLSDISFGEPVYYNDVLTRVNSLKCALTWEDERPVIGFLLPGTPATLNIIDVKSEKLLHIFPLQGQKSASAIIERHPNGDLYFGGVAGTLELFRYSPSKKEVTKLGELDGETALMSMCFDDDGNVYAGTYPNAKIFKYSPMNNQLSSFGRVLPFPEQYVFSLDYHKGKLYFGPRGNDSKLYVMDLKSLKSEIVPFFDPSIKMNAVWRLRTVDKYLVTLLSAESADVGLFLAVYDLELEKWVGKVEKVTGDYVTPELDSKVYFLKEGFVHEYDLKSLKERKLENMKYGSYLRGDGYIDYDDPEYPGKSYVNFQFTGNYQIWNFETQKMKTIDLNTIVPGAPSETRSIVFGEDGRLYISEYQGMKAAALDPKTRQVEYFHMAQPESMVSAGDKIFFGCYTDAEIFILDINKPFSAKFNKDDPGINPRLWGELGEQQDRPFNMIAEDGKVFVASFPGYGQLGGALSIFDIETDTVKVYRNIVPNQSPLGLAYRNGIIYVSTSVSGGLGLLPTEKNAKIIAYDIEKGEVIKEITPKIPGVLVDLKAIAGLKFGPDGKLWAMAKNVIFAMDADTFEIEKYKVMGPLDFGDGTLLYWPINIWFDSKSGLIFASPGNRDKIKIIDPDTLNYMETPFTFSTNFIMGKDGNIYAYIFGGACMVPVIRKGDNSHKLIGKNVSHIGSNKIYLSGEEHSVDDKNDNAAPFVENNRVMFPVSLFARIINANILYDEESELNTISKNNITFSFKKDNVVIINDETRRIGVPAIEKNETLYMSLKLMADVFSVDTIIFDDGLIVIDTSTTSSNIKKDNELIAIMSELFN